MAEQHDADREPQPIDEEAAWAAIVAGYGEEPADPPGAKPFKSVEDLALLESEVNETPKDRTGGQEPDPEADPEGEGEADRPALGSSITFAPGVGGPRDYAVSEPGDDVDDSDDDEGHFVPPEPPPLPEADVTARFAWLAVVGGPVLMLVAVLLQWDMTWWLTTLCVGGFLGGFVTLVARMTQGDDEDDDPGRGAVV
ncbi:hypothetical protein [Streptomyces sp. NBC_00829]|uniref:hypothetical protein n=1 Tax=Streptomyces sp. NBC_00829 TaxID=2903679 RepID=UPI003867EADF|nr:hypothetical protein OG293_26995 [Streptomyces sp. NBC_00829]